MKENKSPYRSDELLKATQKLKQRIRETAEVDDREIEQSFRNVMGRVERAQPRSKRYLLYGWIASAVAVIGIVLATTWWGEKEETYSGLDFALLNDTTIVSTGEVTLIAGKQTMNLKNEAFLKYDVGGSSNIRQYVLNKQATQALHLENEIHTIVVPVGKRADIVFSDGTKMYVNSGSKVVYPDVFAEDKREILVEGEVYLDVAKNQDRPFVVKTKGFDIRVLGTSFNVCAYDGETSASVVLVRGSVVITTKDKQEVQLEPNQLIDIEGNETAIHPVDVSEYISWKDYMLQVNGKSLTDIFKKLELYYGCKIQYDPEIASMSLTGKLDLLPTIENVMENLCFSFSLHYTIHSSKEIYVSLK